MITEKRKPGFEKGEGTGTAPPCYDAYPNMSTEPKSQHDRGCQTGRGACPLKSSLKFSQICLKKRDRHFHTSLFCYINGNINNEIIMEAAPATIAVIPKVPAPRLRAIKPTMIPAPPKIIGIQKKETMDNARATQP